jgi:hypothetical protein
LFSYFRHETIRKYVILFGSYFDDITVQRYDRNPNTSNTTIQTLGVPLAYGPKQKFIVRLGEDPDLAKKVGVQLPRMGFELISVAYDPQRKLNSTQKNFYVKSDDNTVNRTQYTPVPYNFDFVLSAFVKNADDGTQIIEQILPYFKPEWSSTVNLIPEMGISMDIPTILNSVDIEDSYEGDFISRRALVWNLNFTMKGYLYGPTSTSGLITRAQIDLHANTDITTTRSERIVTVPGLLANGSPTTNSAASLPRDQIKSTDDYGSASNTFFFADGKRYNPISGRDE